MKQVKLNEWIRLYQKHQASLCLLEGWEDVKWREVEREVFRLQKNGFIRHHEKYQNVGLLL